MTKTETIKQAGRHGYFQRAGSLIQVTCPACKTMVDCDGTSFQSVTVKIKSGMKHHLSYGGCAAFPE